MATNIKLKRSAVQGKVPTTSDLDLGEIAINTYDGIFYSKKDSGSPEVRSIPTADSGGTFEALDVIDITANVVTVNNYIDLTPRDHPTHNEGRFFYDSVHKTLNFNNDITNLQFELGTNEYIRVYNDTGNTIPNGAALYLSGYTATDPVVPKAFLADATDGVKYNTSGLAAASIADGEYGYCAVSGVVRGSDSDPFDTSGLTAGVRAFVSATTPGALQQPAPSYPNYPMCMGLVVVSDANNGVFVVEQQMHAVPQFRVEGDAYVGSDLTVAGDFTVLGTETTVSLQNISVDDTFFYLGSGDTIANTEFVPANANTPGLNDATYSGYYEGTTVKTISVRIDSTGATDTFEWSDDNFATTGANNVAITGSAQEIVDNIKITFSATTGHTLGDRWDGDVAPSDLDFGIIGNYSNSTLYSHAGLFRDASDRRFKFFKRYDPEIEGTVDTSNSSFQYADIQANSFFGHTITANVVGSVTGTVSDLSNHDTDDLAEGNTNFYYTTARANTDIDARVTTAFVDALNVDADTLDGLNSTQFLRSDADDTLNGSLTITGDLTVQGNSISIDVQSIAVEDPLIFLAKNQTSGDTLDIGFVAHYTNGSANLHTGFFRDANTKDFFVMGEYQTDGNEQNYTVVDTSNAVFKVANVVMQGAYIGWNTSTETADAFIYSTAQNDLRVDANNDILIQPTGNVGINNTAPTHKLSVNGDAYVGTNLTVVGDVGIGDSLTGTESKSITAAAANVIDQFAISTYRSAKYIVQIDDGTDYLTTELLVLHNGTDTRITEYGTVYTDTIATFSANIVGANVDLICTPTVGNTSIKLYKTYIEV